MEYEIMSESNFSPKIKDENHIYSKKSINVTENQNFFSN